MENLTTTLPNESVTAMVTLNCCDACAHHYRVDDLSQCLRCGQMFCQHRHCSCPVIVENEEEAAFLREEDPDVVVIIDPQSFAN